MINGQQIPEQQDKLSFMQQEVIGQLNYFNKDCYIIDKENYDKEIYDYILQQITSGSYNTCNDKSWVQYNCLNEETYIIGEAYGKGLSDEQIIRKIKINKEYYIIDKEVYDKIYDHLRFQQFVERLNVKLINHNNTEFYGINKESYKYIISERIPRELKEQVINNISVQEDYYGIKKDVYTGYFQTDQQIQKFMERFVIEHDKFKGYYLIYKENYNNFFRNIISNKEFRPAKIVKEYLGINKETYDKYILKIDRPTPEQQVELILQNFTQRKVLGRLNYLGEECYVIDKENYNNFLDRTQANKQEVINQAVRPIRISVDYYIIIKHVYESRLGPVDTNSCNNTKKNVSEELMNDILSRNQALEEECKQLKKQKQVFENEFEKLKSQNQAIEDERGNLKSQNLAFETKYENLKSQNQTLKLQNEELKKKCEDLGNKNTELWEEVTKYQSELGDATSFHLGNQDSNSTSQLSDNIRKLHEKLVRFCNVKREVDINFQELKELMKKYGCLPTNDISKNLISGVLEHAVIETIIEKTEAYFNSNATDKQQLGLEAENNEKQQPYLEAEIFNTTDKLLKMTELFTKIRVGTDRVSEAVPTKLRQQVYAILGNRGFSQTFEDENDSKEHLFIVKLRDDILDLMDRYRRFKDQERLKKSTEEINKIIREVINIFFFRLNVQQPIATWYWLPKGTEINTLRMEASWDENETDDLRFDICAFPLIGSNINQSNEKVIVPAQVVMNTLDE
ncbi:unnamed protein product [Rhizophagus irregularis]|nr:unnamed protein product [Rhizophagus irregularis]